MNETTKTLRVFSDSDFKYIEGCGIDIGCGPDPVTPSARRFDLEHGDANRITEFISDRFDFVYSSHCLEHMRDPKFTIQDWWKLVRRGGYLIVIVPDEDLYEQGVFPSRFNPDHKATFTISKSASWSPVSHNVFELGASLPGGRVVKLALQDIGYDRSLLRFGPDAKGLVPRLCRGLRRRFRSKQFGLGSMDRWMLRWYALDQTYHTNALAQILLVVKREFEM